MYRYFIQPQLNKFNNSIIGYELLIRELIDDRWKLPQYFSDIPTDIMVDTLLKTTASLALKVGAVSFNLNRTQIMNEAVDDALMRCQDRLRPLKLIIEVTEEPGDEKISNQELLGMLSRFREHGMDISLDDVGTGENSYEHIKDFLPITAELKFALQNFDEHIQDRSLQRRIRRWQKIAHDNRQRFIIEGIEDRTDDQVADQLEIKHRQGYYYGKPHLLKIEKTDHE